MILSNKTLILRSLTNWLKLFDLWIFLSHVSADFVYIFDEFQEWRLFSKNMAGPAFFRVKIQLSSSILRKILITNVDQWWNTNPKMYHNWRCRKIETPYCLSIYQVKSYAIIHECFLENQKALRKLSFASFFYVDCGSLLCMRGSLGSALKRGLLRESIFEQQFPKQLCS